MTASRRRTLRMLFKAMLLISLPLTGFLWALPSGTVTLTWAVVLTLLSIAMGVGAEVLAASNETELKDLGSRFEADSRRRAEELAIRDEKLRQFDRIVALLTEQNHSLRGKLISMQVDLQRRKDGLVPHAEPVELPADLAPVPRPVTGTRGH